MGSPERRSSFRCREACPARLQTAGHEFCRLFLSPNFHLKRHHFNTRGLSSLYNIFFPRSLHQHYPSLPFLISFSTPLVPHVPTLFCHNTVSPPLLIPLLLPVTCVPFPTPLFVMPLFSSRYVSTLSFTVSLSCPRPFLCITPSPHFTTPPLPTLLVHFPNTIFIFGAQHVTPCPFRSISQHILFQTPLVPYRNTVFDPALSSTFARRQRYLSHLVPFSTFPNTTLLVKLFSTTFLFRPSVPFRSISQHIFSNPARPLS